MLEVMVEDVPHWIQSKAHEVADAYEQPWNDEFANEVLTELVTEKCEGFGGDRCTGLALIAHYGWTAALYGGVDFDDSPINEFMVDVQELAKAYLECERGITID